MHIPEGTVLCGFGKGRFKPGAPDGDNDVLFEIGSADEKAIMDGVCKPLSDYMAVKRQNAPDKPPLCYHTVSLEPETQTWTVTLDS